MALRNFSKTLIKLQLKEVMELSSAFVISYSPLHPEIPITLLIKEIKSFAENGFVT